MKKRFIAIFLTGGLGLGLCGCGSNKSTAVSAVETEEDTSISEEAESAQEDYQEDESSRYTADELENMWSSESLTKEEIGTMFSVGVISNEVYEEFLNRMSEDVEFNTTEDEDPESLVTNMDASSLLTAHVIEFEDVDGYQIRETIQISPIFREDDLETVHALWEALGNDVADFPSKEELYDISWAFRSMRDRLSCNELEYIVGTYMVENLTNGFPITSDSPRSYDRYLITERIPAFDDEHDVTATDFFSSSLVSMVMYPNGAVYYSDPGPVTVGKPKMVSDIWGPCAFIIALPNKRTPNQLDGYRYDKVEISIGNKGYGDSGYDVFELAYYE